MISVNNSKVSNYSYRVNDVKLEFNLTDDQKYNFLELLLRAANDIKDELYQLAPVKSDEVVTDTDSTSNTI